MQVTLRQVGAAAFDAETGSGHAMRIDGSPDLGGENAGMRPMEAFLIALAGCSAMDVIHILRRMRKPADDLKIHVEGRRRDAVPATFEHVQLVFQTGAEVPRKDLERAIQLSIDKYCSVARMLQPDVEIGWEARLSPA